jgi:Ala-tRNA(Pro) deacylase
MPVKKLKEFLDSNLIEYVSIHHSRAYTAQRIAASAHIPGKEIAKTVMIKLDGKMAMAVLPASNNLSFDLLKGVSKAGKVELANETEFRTLFPECDTGAMPPFGNLYGMQVFCSDRLALDEEIAFNAGSHNELIRMAYKDFDRLVKPVVAKLTR